MKRKDRVHAANRHSQVERLFREAASLDIDKEDIKRYEEFVTSKIGDLLLRAEANARANGRDIIQPHDLPITKGLQECIHVFEHLDKDIGLAPLLNDFPLRPQPLATELSDEAQDRLPRPPSASAVPRRKSGRRCSPLRLPSRSNLHSSPSLPAVSFLGGFQTPAGSR